MQEKCKTTVKKRRTEQNNHENSDRQGECKTPIKERLAVQREQENSDR